MANFSDAENRGTIIFAWWMACICDAYSSVYYRRKPMLDDDDYDIDFYTAESTGSESDSQKPMPSPRVQLEVAFCHCIPRLYLTSANSFWFVSPSKSRMLRTKSTKRDITAQHIHWQELRGKCHATCGSLLSNQTVSRTTLYVLSTKNCRIGEPSISNSLEFQMVYSQIGISSRSA
jgi:hypothetical protein